MSYNLDTTVKRHAVHHYTSAFKNSYTHMHKIIWSCYIGPSLLYNIESCFTTQNILSFASYFPFFVIWHADEK